MLRKSHQLHNKCSQTCAFLTLLCWATLLRRRSHQRKTCLLWRPARPWTSHGGKMLKLYPTLVQRWQHQDSSFVAQQWTVDLPWMDPDITLCHGFGSSKPIDKMGVEMDSFSHVTEFINIFIFTKYLQYLFTSYTFLTFTVHSRETVLWLSTFNWQSLFLFSTFALFEKHLAWYKSG